MSEKEKNKKTKDWLKTGDLLIKEEENKRKKKKNSHNNNRRRKKKKKKFVRKGVSDIEKYQIQLKKEEEKKEKERKRMEEVRRKKEEEKAEKKRLEAKELLAKELEKQAKIKKMNQIKEPKTDDEGVVTVRTVKSTTIKGVKRSITIVTITKDEYEKKSITKEMDGKEMKVIEIIKFKEADLITEKSYVNMTEKDVPEFEKNFQF